jgi:hypothetical protein
MKGKHWIVIVGAFMAVGLVVAGFFLLSGILDAKEADSALSDETTGMAQSEGGAAWGSRRRASSSTHPRPTRESGRQSSRTTNEHSSESGADASAAERQPGILQQWL